MHKKSRCCVHLVCLTLELFDQSLLDGGCVCGIEPSHGLFAQKLIEPSFGFEVVLCLRVLAALIEAYHLRKFPDIKATLCETLFGFLLKGFELVLEDGDLAESFPLVDQEAAFDALGILLSGWKFLEFFFEEGEAFA